MPDQALSDCTPTEMKVMEALFEQELPGGRPLLAPVDVLESLRHKNYATCSFTGAWHLSVYGHMEYCRWCSYTPTHPVNGDTPNGDAV